MYERLGLGITLDFDDRASQKTAALCNQFERLIGVSGQLVKSFNAGIASLHFEGLTVAGFALQRLGVQMNYWGEKIVKGFIGMGKAAVEAGARMEKYQKMFEVFYKSAPQANRMIETAMDYAAKTPFQMEDVISAMKSLKAIGVEAFDPINNATVATQNLMDAIGNLAILAPPEQGLKGLMIAIRNLYGGNARSFMMRMDINPSQILGRQIGKTTQEVTDAIVELSQKLTPDMMQKLFGTWEQTVSNFSDQYQRLLYYINKGGAFDAAKKTLMDLYTTISRIDKDEMKEIGSSLGEVFRFLWKPIDLFAQALKKVVIVLKDMSKEYPWLFKIITGLVLGSGVFMIITGAILKFSGSILMAIAAIATFYVNIIMLRLQTNLMNLSLLRSIKTIGLFIKSLMLGALLFSGAVYAYQKNLFGFRDSVDEATADIRKAWKSAWDLIYGGLDNRGPLFAQLQGMEKTFARIIAMGELVKILFTQDLGIKTYFTKKQRQDLEGTGLWDLAKLLVMLKYRMKEFVRGFVDGFKTIGGMFKTFFGGVLVPLKAFFGMLDRLVTRITGKQSIFGIILGDDKDIAKWEYVGQMVGKIVGLLLGLKVLRSLGGAIVSPFIAMSKALTGVGEKLKWSGGFITKAFKNQPFFYYDGKGRSRTSNTIQDMLDADPDNPVQLKYSRNPFKRLMQQRMMYKAVTDLKLQDLSERGKMTPLLNLLHPDAEMRKKILDTTGMDDLTREAHLSKWSTETYNDPMQGFISRALFGRRSLTFGSKINDLGVNVPYIRQINKGGILGNWISKKSGKDYYGWGDSDLGLPYGSHRSMLLGAVGSHFRDKIDDYALQKMYPKEYIKAQRLQKALDTHLSKGGSKGYLWSSQLKPLNEFLDENKVSKRMKNWGDSFKQHVVAPLKTGVTALKTAGGFALGGARGVVRGGGSILRGAGSILGMGFRALPYLGLGIAGGKAIYDIIAQGGDNKAFNKNLNAITATLRKDGPKMAKEFWGNFKEIAKETLKTVGDFFKEVWRVVKSPEGQQILKEAWEGLKAGAIMVWNFIRPYLSKAITTFGEWLAYVAIPVMVYNISENAGEFLTAGMNLGSKLAEGIVTALVNVINSNPLASMIFGALLGGSVGGLPGAAVGGTIPLYTYAATKNPWGTAGYAGSVGGIPGYLGSLAVSGKLQSMVNSYNSKGVNNTNSPMGISGGQGTNYWLGKASGTDYWSGGDVVVGEKGPELLRNVRKGTQIVPNKNLRAGNGTNINVGEMKVVVQADKLSRADAKQQALMILEEFKNLSQEKRLRTGNPSLGIA